MLQISNGNFFTGTRFYETTHRAPLYTNMVLSIESFDLIIGKLYKANSFGKTKVIIAEVFEKQESHDPQGNMNVLISTSGAEMINDFSLLVSFFLNTLCTTSSAQSHELLHPIISTSTHIDPKKYIHGFFNETNYIKEEELHQLKAFTEKLFNIKRINYEIAMKAMRRYVTAMARISDDIDAAYALLVASIESLAQYHLDYETTWADYDESKRKSLDGILTELKDETANKIRNKIISQEHVGISRKFFRFILDSLNENFYQSNDLPFKTVGKRDLEIAIKSAYAMRSKYVHTLATLPKDLTDYTTLDYTTMVEGKPFLTFNGLAAIAREVIKTFVMKQDECKKENINTHLLLPNVALVKLADIYWMSNKKDYTKKNYNAYLKALLNKIEQAQNGTAGIQIPDMRDLLGHIEKTIAGLRNDIDRANVLSFYALGYASLYPNELKEKADFISNYEKCFETISIYSLSVKQNTRIAK